MVFATGGQPLNSDDFFKATAPKARDVSLKEMLAKKKSLQEGLLLENTVMELLQTKGSLCAQNASHFTVTEIKLILKWKNVKSTSAKKADLLAAYYNTPPTAHGSLVDSGA
jgi:hypothetical protein